MPDIRPDVNRAPELTPEIERIVDDMFEYHDWSEEQTRRGRNVREVLAHAVKAIVATVPPSPDRTVAIRKLREARMDCNSAITHGGKY